MYGTVAQMKVKPGQLDALRDLAATENVESVPGFRFQYVYQMDANPDAVILVVAFESKDAYFANANSPEQHQRYLKFREHLAEDPVWHDGAVIFP